MTMLIEVAAIEPPKGEKKPAIVTTVTGRAFDAWPEILAKLSVGARYRVEFAARESKGRTYYKIVKAQPANGAAPDGHAANGHAANGKEQPLALPGTSPPAPADAASERAFVAAALAGFIHAGKVGPDEAELGRVALMLRRTWRFAFAEIGLARSRH